MEKPRFEKEIRFTKSSFRVTLGAAIESHLSFGNEGYDLATRLMNALKNDDIEINRTEAINRANAQVMFERLVGQFRDHGYSDPAKLALAIEDVAYALKAYTFG